MLAAKIVAEVRRLLETKTHSQRRIAALLGISRGSVAAIALGRRREPQAKAAGEAVFEDSGPPTRCSGCGAMVHMPCLLCRLRKETPRRPAHRVPDLPATMRLDLRPEHRQRYEEVRLRRRTMSTNEERAQS
jgi:hypothetical protein